MGRRTLAELRDVAEPAWPLVAAWFAAARNSIEVLPADRAWAEQTLLHLQVTAGSPLGALALETGGVLVDGGWLRLLGSGNARLRGSLYSWNGGDGGAANVPLAQALIVAHDAAGGFFALNGGAFPGARGAVHYFAPDTLRWEGLDLSYSDLLTWAAGGDLRGFYAGGRWPGWEDEVRSLPGDRGFSIYPPLWTQPEAPPAARSRRPVPMEELWALHQEVSRQLRDT